jgi:hypothetical protein
MYKIPFFVWSNDHADLVNYRDNKFVTDDVIHGMMDLYDTKVKQFDISKSIFSHSFEPKVRFSDGL